MKIQEVNEKEPQKSENRKNEGGSGGKDALTDLVKNDLDSIGRPEQGLGSGTPPSGDSEQGGGEPLENAEDAVPQKDRKGKFEVNINYDEDKFADGPLPAPEMREDTGEVLYMDETPAIRAKEAEERRNRRMGCLKAGIYTAVILCLSVVIAITALSCLNDMYAVSKPSAEISVEIPSGASYAKIAQILKDDKVIQNGLAFRLYLKFSHVTNLKQGKFELNSNMGYDEIVNQLSDSSNDTSTVNVTIPEGYTVTKIAQLLESSNVCSSSEFLSAVNKDTFQFQYLSGIGNASTRLYRLEGYCFPDTYNFYTHDTAKDVIQKMLDNFEKKYTSALAAKAKKAGMSLDQVLTLASVIQKESADTANMAKVSSVFHNRLEKGTGSLRYLQSDATVLYVKNVIDPVLKKTGTAVGNAYNTYKTAGLPAGPICNPGTDAINAALSPKKTDYFYFVTDKNNKYYYAKTYQQHLANVKKALATGAAQGTDTSSK